MDWQLIKDYAHRVYGWIAEISFALLICLWLLGCVVGRAPLGPSGYVKFVDHVFKWEAYERIPIAKINARER